MTNAIKAFAEKEASYPGINDQPWWRGASIYQIYPRSFCDSKGDGIGDLPGITSKLEYVASLGVEAIWLSPFFLSPMADYGYDVADFCDVDPIFGTLQDFDNLVARAHQLGLKVIIDQVYSHSSDQHPWFQESRSSRDNEKADWYVWADPKADGTPPNNWLSVFSGSAWEWDARRGQYYLHNFLPEQPDLNLHNPKLREAILAVPRFWLARGVDGFRLDALNFGFHDQTLVDNPAATQFLRPPKRPHDFQKHVNNMSQPEIYPFLEDVRALMDEYPGKFSVAEIGGPFPLQEMKAYTGGDNRLNTAYAFDFLYAESLSANFVRKVLKDWPGGEFDGWPSWAFSNHDAPRAISRWRGACPSDQYAKLLCLLITGMRGNIFIYQGEELGMNQAEIAFEDLKDPEAIANWPHTLGRDGARTPMPWDDSHPNAGFSAAKAWLPIDPEHQKATVSIQENDRDSVLNFWRQAIKLRKTVDVLRYGDHSFPECDERLFVCRRTYAGESILIIVNVTPEVIAYEWENGVSLIETEPFSTGSVAPWSAAIIAVEQAY